MPPTPTPPQAATTHGIYYALERGVLPLSNLFWVATFLSLLVVALYLTASAYIGQNFLWIVGKVLLTFQSSLSIAELNHQ